MTVVILGSVVALAMYFQGPRRNAEVLPPDATATYAGPRSLAVAGGLQEPVVARWRRRCDAAGLQLAAHPAAAPGAGRSW
jgi:hypothetical protein